MAAAQSGSIYDPSSVIVGNSRGTNNYRASHLANFSFDETGDTNNAVSLSYGLGYAGGTSDYFYGGHMSRSHPIYKTLVSIHKGGGNNSNGSYLDFFTADHPTAGAGIYYTDRHFKSTYFSGDIPIYNRALTHTFHKDYPISVWCSRASSSNNGEQLYGIKMEYNPSAAAYHGIFYLAGINSGSKRCRSPSINSDLNLISYESANSHSNGNSVQLAELTGTSGNLPGGFTGLTNRARIDHPAGTAYSFQNPQMLGDTGYLCVWSQHNSSGQDANQYLSAYMGFQYVYDISNPSSPTKVAEVLHSSTGWKALYQHVYTGYDEASQVYFKISGFNQGGSAKTYLATYDMSDPTNPTQLHNNALSNVQNTGVKHIGWADGIPGLFLVSTAYSNSTYFDYFIHYKEDQSRTFYDWDTNGIQWWSNLSNDPGTPTRAYDPNGIFSFV